MKINIKTVTRSKIIIDIDNWETLICDDITPFNTHKFDIKT